jgi:hypothetical protein
MNDDQHFRSKLLCYYLQVSIMVSNRGSQLGKREIKIFLREKKNSSFRFKE